MKRCLCLLLLYAIDAWACDPQAGEKRGYWFYQTCETQTQARPEPEPLPAPAELMRLHPKDLAQLLEERKEYALWKQTPASVRDYYIVQDAVRRKALAFTALSQYVMTQNPQLNARSQYPIIEPGRRVATQLHDQMIERTLDQYREHYALALFGKKTCPYCPAQRAILRYFQDRHGWEMTEFDIQQKPELAARFNVTVTPMTLLIERGSRRWMPVSVGVESLPEIENGVYRAIRLLRGEIQPQQYFLNDYDTGGFFDPAATQEAKP